jgi:hypothetical protein
MISKVAKDKRNHFKQILKENGSEISKSQHGRHVLSQLDSFKNK